jgi:predicted ATPase
VASGAVSAISWLVLKTFQLPAIPNDSFLMPKRTKPYLLKASFKSDAQIDCDAYPFNIPAVRDLESIEFHSNVTFFVGENGSGKSTVMEAIAVALGFGAEGGTMNVQFKTTDSTSNLHEFLRLARGTPKPRDGYFLRAESFFNVATYMDEMQYLDSYGGRSLHQQSHGESFMAVLLNKLRGDGLYFLDEPEAALSPSRQLAALSAIHQLVEDSSQLIIATHSPILLAYPHAKIIRFDATGLSEVSFEDTDHFNVTRDFLNNYSRRLEQLLNDCDDT